MRIINIYSILMYVTIFNRYKINWLYRKTFRLYILLKYPLKSVIFSLLTIATKLHIFTKCYNFAKILNLSNKNNIFGKTVHKQNNMLCWTIRYSNTINILISVNRFIRNYSTWTPYKSKPIFMSNLYVNNQILSWNIATNFTTP